MTRFEFTSGSDELSSRFYIRHKFEMYRPRATVTFFPSAYFCLSIRVKAAIRKKNFYCADTEGQVECGLKRTLLMDPLTPVADRPGFNFLLITGTCDKWSVLMLMGSTVGFVKKTELE